LQYLIGRRDFKSDYAWIGQPWGQFFIAGISLAIFGHDTVPARLPFACAGFLTVLSLYLFTRALSLGRTVAGVASLLLLGNVYWILHARQCRYYALSSLLLLLAAWAWTRWMRRDAEPWRSGSPLGAVSGRLRHVLPVIGRSR
jgi:4-amino-4-deoxy-L-arabinose transferase-like glycosyltransferase